MSTVSIGEAARRTGVAATALRYYEDTGVLPRVARVRGRRRYDAASIRRIGLLRFAQQAGFSLDEVKTLFASDAPLHDRWESIAKEKLNELDALAELIERMRRDVQRALACRCERIEDCTLSPTDSPAPSRTSSGVRARRTFRRRAPIPPRA
jgi:DNA-binding transcriptional MerR regulator